MVVMGKAPEHNSTIHSLPFQRELLQPDDKIICAINAVKYREHRKRMWVKYCSDQNLS